MSIGGMLVICHMSFFFFQHSEEHKSSVSEVKMQSMVYAEADGFCGEERIGRL